MARVSSLPILLALLAACGTSSTSGSAAEPPGPRAAAAAVGGGVDGRAVKPVPPAPAPAASADAASPITMAASVEGSWLSIALTNAGDEALTLAARVEANEIHHDWLRVDLEADDGARRTLRFIDARKESALIEVALGPGATHTERVDLASWAVRAQNGEPLAPGVYDLSATWDASRESRGVRFVATATATLVIAAPGGWCATRNYKTPAGAKVELLARQAAGGGAVASVGLHNAGTAPVCVWSHITTHEWQSDWLELQYSDGMKYHHAPRRIALDDSRDKSVPVSVLLAPGATVWHTIDVAAWAARSRNGAEALPAGRSLWVLAVYDTSKDDEVWAGRLIRSFELVVP